MNDILINEKMTIALKIREEMHNILKKHNVKTEICNDDVNPFHNQLDENCDGLECEYYYGFPSKIYTPLGSITITCGYMVCDENAENAVKEMEEKFGFILKKGEIINSIGTFGKWVHITKLPWNDEKLKCDSFGRDRNLYIPYDKAKELYKGIKYEVGV